jgi:hypothetical protein
MQLFHHWSPIRLAMICDGALLRESGATIVVDSRKQRASTIFHHRIPPASIGD